METKKQKKQKAEVILRKIADLYDEIQSLAYQIPEIDHKTNSALSYSIDDAIAGRKRVVENVNRFFNK